MHNNLLEKIKLLEINKDIDDISLKFLKKKYRELAKKYHPDTSEYKDGKKFVELEAAYDFLVKNIDVLKKFITNKSSDSGNEKTVSVVFKEILTFTYFFSKNEAITGIKKTLNLNERINCFQQDCGNKIKDPELGFILNDDCPECRGSFFTAKRHIVLLRIKPEWVRDNTELKAKTYHGEDIKIKLKQK